MEAGSTSSYDSGGNARGPLVASYREITIVPARGCRRSRVLLDYLRRKEIPFRLIELESEQGQALAEQYDMRASPGIIVDGASINPYDLLVQGACRVNEQAAQRVLLVDTDSEPVRPAAAGGEDGAAIGR